jgi:hypothetical protein
MDTGGSFPGVNQIQHKPPARAKKNFELLKLHTYEALHQRRISIGIIAGDKKYFLWYQPKKNKFIHSN